jgi:hypothetical protein
MLAFLKGCPDRLVGGFETAPTNTRCHPSADLTSTPVTCHLSPLTLT